MIQIDHAAVNTNGGERNRLVFCIQRYVDDLRAARFIKKIQAPGERGAQGRRLRLVT